MDITAVTKSNVGWFGALKGGSKKFSLVVAFSLSCLSMVGFAELSDDIKGIALWAGAIVAAAYLLGQSLVEALAPFSPAATGNGGVAPPKV